MTKVRDCTEDDIPFLIEKAKKFNDAYYDIPLDEDKLAVFLKSAINSSMGVVLRSDHGAIVGVLILDPCRNWTALVEIAWYSEGRDGIALLKAFEKRGKESGVNEIRMTTLESNRAVDKILHRRGYAPVETSHRLLL